MCSKAGRDIATYFSFRIEFSLNTSPSSFQPSCPSIGALGLVPNGVILGAPPGQLVMTTRVFFLGVMFSMFHHGLYHGLFAKAVLQVHSG